MINRVMLKNNLGCLLLWGMYAGTAELWSWGFKTSFDHALLVIGIMAIAQLRWHQPESK